ncbi:nucleotidyltransferase domain-containing protein [Candidatus Woesearchaeota archaeon]|nr:nucleotidyltransferase domain-containing protein [Candidatus Woesearchaeota archaeon]
MVVGRRIMEHFLQHPTAKLRVRQVERETGISLPSVIRHVKRLAQEGILKQQEIGGVTLYTADRANEAYKKEKRLHNLRAIHESGLLRHLIDELDNPSIILFGSYDKGDDTEDSDIDLYIQTPSKKKPRLDAYEKKLERSIQPHISKRLDDIKNDELKDNIINGTILNGHVEVFA